MKHLATFWTYCKHLHRALLGQIKRILQGRQKLMIEQLNKHAQICAYTLQSPSWALESHKLSEVYFHYYCVTLRSTDCGCNQCFHLVPVSCHYYRVHVQKLSVYVSYVALCCCWVKKNVFFATEFILNLLVVKHFLLSLPSSCTLILGLFFLSMMDAKCALFYFSIVFNCFHTITQDIQLSTLILYLFYYNLLLYHSYDY